MIQRRDVAVAIILTIVTCGIYGIYWFISMTNEVNAITGTPGDTSGGVAFLLTIVTCGLYSYYWAYKMGDKLDKYENTASQRGLTYVVLTVFGLGIVAYALLQDSINKAI